MPKKWTYKYNQNTIIIENSIIGETLTINGEIQDKKTGITPLSLLKGAELIGKLPSGEEVKANLGGFFTTTCTLFVDNKLLGIDFI